MWFKRIVVLIAVIIVFLICRYVYSNINLYTQQQTETIDDINKKIEEIDKRINAVDKKIANINAELEETKEKIQNTEQKIQELNEKIHQISKNDIITSSNTQHQQNTSNSQTISRGSIRRINKQVPKNTSMKSWMDYRAITSKNSAQYKLQQQNNVYTDNEGFRRIGNDYIIAVGSYYATEIGTRVEVKLSSGNVFTATIGDCKADKHTDALNQKHISDGSMLEFLVDSKNLNKDIKKMGDCSYAKDGKFKGEVVSIVILQEEN